MKFKEFSKWCNERACDGCWGAYEAIFCVSIGTEIRRKPFWKREKKWQKMNSELSIEETIVNPINNMIRNRALIKE